MQLQLVWGAGESTCVVQHRELVEIHLPNSIKNGLMIDPLNVLVPLRIQCSVVRVQDWKLRQHVGLAHVLTLFGLAWRGEREVDA